MREAFIELLRGNAAHAREFQSAFDDVQASQAPPVVTVCCADSRVLQDHMWHNDDPGQVFTCANIGNRVVQQTAVGEVVSGDVLYPIEHTGTETAVVVGHTGCGAVTATYDALTGEVAEAPGIEHCLALLEPHLEAALDLLPDDASRPEAINRLVEYNVDRQVEFLRRSAEIPDSVDVVGVVYDFQDVYSERRGEVHVINVDGTTDVAELREEHAEVADRIDRLWTY
ncbi:MAG: carbonic anhydrase [Halopenitus sp.]